MRDSGHESVEHAQGDGRTRGGKDGQAPGARCSISEGGAWRPTRAVGGQLDEQQTLQRRAASDKREAVWCGVWQGPDPDPGTRTWRNERLSLPRPEDKEAQFSGDSPARGKVGVAGRKPGSAGTAAPVPEAQERV